MLDKFRAAKLTEIEHLREAEAKGKLHRPWHQPRPDFVAALNAHGVPGERAAVIAEFKRASPSLGDINVHIAPEEVARMYAGGGAAAISCLTERKYFRGNVDFIGLMHAREPEMPILRKDFLLDPIQIRATAATPASAALLIVRMGSEKLLEVMLAECVKYGLAGVVEIFDETDLTKARHAGASIIQVNTRDLDTLEVDPGNAQRLVADRHDGETWICASGIKDEGDAAAMARLGYDSVLVGTALMQAKDPGAKLAELTGKAHDHQDVRLR